MKSRLSQSAREMCLQFSVDPKPAAAFIEYTVKPLIDDSRELLEILKEQGLSIKDLKLAVGLFIFERLLSSLTAIIVTSLICYTASNILRYQL